MSVPSPIDDLWTGEKGSEQPNFIQPAGNEEVLWFAGLSSRWHDLLTCTIVTRTANGTVHDVHTRWPVILNSDESGAWMKGASDAEIGVGASLRHHCVAQFGICDVGPELIEAGEW